MRAGSGSSRDGGRGRAPLPGDARQGQGAVAPLPPLGRSFPAAPRSLRESYSALREEYLKLRALAVNEHTQLRTHQAVLGELRARLTGSSSLAVIVLGVENLKEIEEALGWRVADDLLARATDVLREFVATHMPNETILAQEGVFGEQLLIFVPRGPASPVASLSDLERLAAAIESAVGEGLSGRHASEAGEARLSTGYSVVSHNPFHRFERQVWRAIAAAQAMRHDQAGRGRYTQRLQLAELIATRDLTVVFQPLIDLRTFDIFGYEALCRGPRGTPFEVADFLFRTSYDLDLAPDLDELCRDIVLTSGVTLTPGRKLFMNVLPESLEGGRVEPIDFLARVRALGLQPSDIVFEVAERSRVADYARFRRQLQPFREAGCMVALDDVGSGYSSLRLVPEVQPDFLKVDMSVIKEIDEHPTKRGVLATIMDLSARLSSRVVCEGIERREELDVVIELGAELGQGFFLLSPASEPALTYTPPSDLR